MTNSIGAGSMPTCPDHPGVLLEKIMGERIMGVWFPYYRCPVDGKVYTYEQIHGKRKFEAEKQLLRSLGGFMVELPPHLRPEEISPVVTKHDLEIKELSRRLNMLFREFDEQIKAIWAKLRHLQLKLGEKE